MIKIPAPSLTLLRALLLAIAYFVFGQLAMLLAIAPGMATSVFPSLGIAIAAALLWGYPMLAGAFLGSLILKLAQPDWPHYLNWSDKVVYSLSMAAITAITVACALWAVRRFAQFHSALTFEKSILWLFALSGPFACLISSILSTLVLEQYGLVTHQNAMLNWFTWWVGDMIGVMIAVPLVFMLFAKPRPLWRARWLTVGLPLLVCTALVIALFVLARFQHHQNLQRKFFDQSEQISATFQFRVSKVLQQMQMLERLFAIQAEVTDEMFQQFLQNYPWNQAGVLFFDWVEVIPHSRRAAVEAELNSLFKEYATPGIKPAAVRPYYSVIRFVASSTGDRSLVGLDLAADPARKEAMDYAMDSGRISISAPVQLVGGNDAALFFIPVYQEGVVPQTIEEKRKKIRGFICGIFETSALVQTSLSQYDTSEFHLQVKDLGTGLSYYGALPELPIQARDLTWTRQWSHAGRSLELQLVPSQTLLNLNSGQQSWYVLTGGLVLCSLLGIFLLVLTGRSARIEHLITQRTKELSSILDNAIESIVIVDQQGLIERVNKETSLLFGFAMSSLLRQPISKLLACLPEHKNHQLLQPLTIDQLNLWVGNTVEVTGLSEDGRQIPLEMGLSRVDIADKHLYTLMLHDLRERKKIDRMKSEFISTVSHELRTPLTSINGSLGLLAGGVVGELPPQAQQLVQIAKTNTDRLARLVNDILDIEKLEFGQLKLQPVEVEVWELLQEAKQQNQAYADKYSVRLNLAAPATQAQLYLFQDKFRLLQILSNLISNAIKFSPSHSVVELSYQRHNDDLVIKVKDQGTGIAESFHTKIFQKFAQADNSDSRSNQGSGLGLNISKTLVEMMHGSIDFESELGKGTCFTLTFPCYLQLNRS
ncbi:PAS domain S-box protein [Rheinheimera sediminis]|uniref:CHASE domain-containing protein n=1 Tax=Rheinheimera sp. YQF-1 TaxID=2499626 RepID=UPI000FDB79C1|nr:CHASE domain-containing protein [Rheinheimera sp. YQF-1]RVT47529.1 PAS domain S-box protein [Rheinheimera sp. YQF-1]